MRPAFISLDGKSLTIDALMLLGKGACGIELTPESAEAVVESRKEATRRLMALRINVLAKGYSGIRLETLQKVIDAFNKDCLPLIPSQGTVGASGDLCHLSHLALGLLGEGQMWDPEEKRYRSAGDVLKRFGLTPLDLQAKEGLSLINGTQFITGVGIEAVAMARNLSRTADYVAALTTSALRGTEVAFYPEIHETRPHPGQNYSAHNIRNCLHSSTFRSEIREKYKVAVQDAYSLRCAPQVHGIVHDTVQFVSSIMTTEINSATDNPMIFSNTKTILSGGNFHGEYPAKALDYLTIATHELGNISERRIERMMNSTLSGGLPWFLVEQGGMNSGFMIAHCTAASLVAENKALCYPASVDSISTSAAKEDHVSMGGWAARKSVQVAKNVEYILAIELMSAVQAIEFLRPEKTTAPLEALHKLVRSKVPRLVEDRVLATDIELVVALVRDGSVLREVENVLLDGGLEIPRLHNTEQMLRVQPEIVFREAENPRANNFEHVHSSSLTEKLLPFGIGLVAGILGYMVVSRKDAS